MDHTLAEVKELRETSSVVEANALLSQGWVLHSMKTCGSKNVYLLMRF